VAHIVPSHRHRSAVVLLLEPDAGVPSWDEFKQLCHQRFGLPLSTNHLADLARLPFTLSVEAYLDAFQA